MHTRIRILWYAECCQLVKTFFFAEPPISILLDTWIFSQVCPKWRKVSRCLYEQKKMDDLLSCNMWLYLTALSLLFNSSLTLASFHQQRADPSSLKTTMSPTNELFDSSSSVSVVFTQRWCTCKQATVCFAAVVRWRKIEMEWSRLVYPSVRERQSLINTICRQVRGGGSSAWFPLISSAYGAFSDNSLYGFSSLQNPMCFSYSIQCLSDTIVVNMIMSLSDQQFCVSVARR